MEYITRMKIITQMEHVILARTDITKTKRVNIMMRASLAIHAAQAHTKPGHVLQQQIEYVRSAIARVIQKNTKVKHVLQQQIEYVTVVIANVAQKNSNFRNVLQQQIEFVELLRIAEEYVDQENMKSRSVLKKKTEYACQMKFQTIPKK